jgi:ABC-type antimicrobial peptide transport system permease subunit
MSTEPVTPKRSSRWPWRRATPPATAAPTGDTPVVARQRRRKRRGRHPDPLRRLAQFDALVAEPPNGETVHGGHSVSTGAGLEAPARAAPMPGSLQEEPVPEAILVDEPEETDETTVEEAPVEEVAVEEVPVEEAPVEEVAVEEVPVEEVPVEEVAVEEVPVDEAAAAVAPAAPRRRRLRRRRSEEQLRLRLPKAARPPRARPWRRATPEPAESAEPTDDDLEKVTVAAAPARDAHQLTLVDPQAALTRPSTITSADLVNEAIAGLFSRPTRTLLTVLGTMIGLTALVATLGLSRTAGNQIVGRFDEIAATEVDVTSRPVDFTDRPNELPWNAAERLERLNGVVAAGSMGKVDVGKALVSTASFNDPLRQTDFKFAVQAVSPTLFDAVRAKLEVGRFFDAGHSERADRVAVIGATAAKELGIDTLDPLPAIQIGDDPFLVIGIVDDVARVDKLMSSVMIPEGTARALYHLRVPDTVVIETDIGAAGLIAEQAPIALRPDNPNGLKVTAQPELTQVRESVSGDLDLLFLTLGGVSLLVGAIGIANVTLVSVMERTGEIGLRRALGATRRHVAQQFLVESTSMGFVGGILGASLGIVIVVLVSAFQGWTPVVDPYIPFVAPLIGGLIGLVAGSYPARRAASMEPVEALRAGT